MKREDGQVSRPTIETLPPAPEHLEPNRPANPSTRETLGRAGHCSSRTERLARSRIAPSHAAPTSRSHITHAGRYFAPRSRPRVRWRTHPTDWLGGSYRPSGAPYTHKPFAHGPLAAYATTMLTRVGCGAEAAAVNPESRGTDFAGQTSNSCRRRTIGSERRAPRRMASRSIGRQHHCGDSQAARLGSADGSFHAFDQPKGKEPATTDRFSSRPASDRCARGGESSGRSPPTLDDCDVTDEQDRASPSQFSRRSSRIRRRESAGILEGGRRREQSKASDDHSP